MSNKKPRKSFLLLLKKKAFNVLKKSRKVSDSQKKSTESLKLQGNFFGSAHFLQHFQNSKREVTDLNQNAKRKKLSVSRKFSKTS